MKKSLSLVLALVFVLSIAGTAMAAPSNPFVDVPAGHWAYDAVAKLAKAGIVEGYGDDTYRGERTITRYEMAQMVAKAMAKSDKADAELKALIDKLAVEYADELNNLGVRVSKLEEKTRISWNFESRIRYSDIKSSNNYHPLSGTDRFDWRQRIILSGDVNDNVSYVARLSTKSDNISKEGDPYNPDPLSSGDVRFGSASSATIGFDQAYFTVKNFLGAFDQVSLGRLDGRGVTNGLLMAKDNNLDGVKVVKTFGDVTFSGLFVDPVYYNFDSNSGSTEIAIGNLDFKLSDNVKVNGAYAKTSMFGEDLKVYDFGTQVKFGDMFLTGEYTNAKYTDADAVKGWAVQLTNGQTGYLYPTYNLVDPKKSHTDAFAISYRKIDEAGYAFIGSAFSYSIPSLITSSNDMYAEDMLSMSSGVKGFLFAYQNVVSKNVVWTVDYQDIKPIDGDGSAKAWTTSFQFFF